MALVQTNAKVLTTPTLVCTIPSGVQYTTVSLYNGSADSIFIGGASVTTTGATRGQIIATEGTAVLCLNAGDSLYAIAASDTNAGDLAIIYSGI
jgi:hypothetical protein